MVPTKAILYSELFKNIMNECTNKDPFVSISWLMEADTGPSGIFYWNNKVSTIIAPYKMYDNNVVFMGKSISPWLKNIFINLDEEELNPTIFSELIKLFYEKNIHGVQIEISKNDVCGEIFKNLLVSSGWKSISETKQKYYQYTLTNNKYFKKTTDDFFHDRIVNHNIKKYIGKGTIKAIVLRGDLLAKEIKILDKIDKEKWIDSSGDFFGFDLLDYKKILEENECQLVVLFIDNAPIGFTLDIIYGAEAFSLMMGYKKEFSEFQLNLILLMYSLFNNAENGIEKYYSFTYNPSGIEFPCVSEEVVQHKIFRSIKQNFMFQLNCFYKKLLTFIN